MGKDVKVVFNSNAKIYKEGYIKPLFDDILYVLDLYSIFSIIDYDLLVLFNNKNVSVLEYEDNTTS